MKTRSEVGRRRRNKGPASSIPAPKRKKVLIADDDENLARALTRHLCFRGYDVETAFSGDETIKKVETKQYDCVLLDQRMPGMSGLDVYHFLQEHRPEVRCALMTAHSEELVSIRADASINENNTYVFPKPFEVIDLETDFLGIPHLPIQYALQQQSVNRERKTRTARSKMKGKIPSYQVQMVSNAAKDDVDVFPEFDI